MKFRRLVFLLAIAFISSSLPAIAANAPKAGAVCVKVGSTQSYLGKKFTCIKSGKKLVWNKGVVIPLVKPSASPSVTATPSVAPSPSFTPTPTQSPSPTPSETPSPTPTPTPTPTGFENLYEARKGISATALKKVSDTIRDNKSKLGSLDINTGPNTKVYFDKYADPLNLVSRAFPNRMEPSQNLVIRFSYADQDWADSILRSKLSAEDYDQLNRNENGVIIPKQCNSVSKDCLGAMQQTANTSRLSIIVQGVPLKINLNELANRSNFMTGMLEAHEYFHALQRIPIMGKANIWPHAWFREGGADFVKNAVVNHEDLGAFIAQQRANCEYLCPKLSEADIIEFLQTTKENYVPAKFDSYLNYGLGALIIEALVSISSQDTLIEMYAQMAKQITFDEAFKNTYGYEWDKAIPILAKTVYANIQGI